MNSDFALNLKFERNSNLKSSEYYVRGKSLHFFQQNIIITLILEKYLGVQLNFIDKNQKLNRAKYFFHNFFNKR